MSQLTRRQLRRLIKEEYYNINRDRRQLNEGVVLTALAYAGIAALSAVGMYVALVPPGIDVGGDETIDPHAMNRYHSGDYNTLVDIVEDIGQDVESGMTEEQAVKKNLINNAAGARAIARAQRSSQSSRPRDGIERHQFSGYPVDPRDDDYAERKYRHGVFGGMGDYRDM